MLLKVFLIIFGALMIIGGIYTVKQTKHFVNNQQKSIKKNQFSSFGIVSGYYEGTVIAVVGVGMLLAGIFISGWGEQLC